MELTKEEKKLIRNWLNALSAYKPVRTIQGYQLYTPIHEELHRKVSE